MYKVAALEDHAAANVFLCRHLTIHCWCPDPKRRSLIASASMRQWNIADLIATGCEIIWVQVAYRDIPTRMSLDKSSKRGFNIRLISPSPGIKPDIDGLRAFIHKLYQTPIIFFM